MMLPTEGIIFLLAILLPESIEKWIEKATETPIQIVYLAVGYVIAMDIMVGLAYYVKRKQKKISGAMPIKATIFFKCSF